MLKRNNICVNDSDDFKMGYDEGYKRGYQDARDKWYREGFEAGFHEWMGGNYKKDIIKAEREYEDNFLDDVYER